jgi:hypothetical protein
MPVHKKKFVPKGIAKTLGTLCKKFEATKASPKRKSAKKRAKKTSRDHTTIARRKVKRRTAKSAVGPWAFRDASYGGADSSYTTVTRTSRSPAKKPKKRKAAKKRAAPKRAKKRSVARDWPGHPILHKRAALLGIRRRARGVTGTKKKSVKKTKKRSTRRDPSWVGESARHSSASRFGWGERFGRENIRTHAHPIRPSGDLSRGTRDPNYFARAPKRARAKGPTRRPSKAGQWDMSYTRAMRDSY